MYNVAFTQISCKTFGVPYFDATCDVTLHCGRILDCITFVVKLDKTRKSRKFRDESLMTCGWYGIVRQPVVEQGRIVAPGIEFNAHCYQRRKDATQLHCLAGLVTAGDIINRLRALHRPFPFFAGLCYELEKARKTASGWGGGWKGEVRGGNTIFCIGKHRRFLVTRDLVIAVYRARGKWNSRGALSLSKVSTAFIKRMNLHKEPLNLQGK